MAGLLLTAAVCSVCRADLGKKSSLTLWQQSQHLLSYLQFLLQMYDFWLFCFWQSFFGLQHCFHVPILFKALGHKSNSKTQRPTHGLKFKLWAAAKSWINISRSGLHSVPVQAATMGGGGEEELWLTQSKALRDPRPDVPHLLGTDDLRGEGVRVKCQLHVPPGDTQKYTHRKRWRGTECEAVYAAGDA